MHYMMFMLIMVFIVLPWSSFVYTSRVLRTRNTECFFFLSLCSLGQKRSFRNFCFIYLFESPWFESPPGIHTIAWRRVRNMIENENEAALRYFLTTRRRKNPKLTPHNKSWHMLQDFVLASRDSESLNHQLLRTSWSHARHMEPARATFVQKLITSCFCLKQGFSLCSPNLKLRLRSTSHIDLLHLPYEVIVVDDYYL